LKHLVKRTFSCNKEVKIREKCKSIHWVNGSLSLTWECSAKCSHAYGHVCSAILTSLITNKNYSKHIYSIKNYIWLKPEILCFETNKTFENHQPLVKTSSICQKLAT